MKLEQNMYVRFEGRINQIVEINDNYITFAMNWEDDDGDIVNVMEPNFFFINYNPKASFKIIEILEVGDFLDNHCIVEIKENTCYLNDGWFISGDDIEDLVHSICTHEMFERGSFEV